MAVTLDTPLTECTQNLKVGGGIECAQGVKAGGNIEADGKLTASSAAIGGIEFGSHAHGEVENGSGTSGGPQ
ncbi:hypothetical protein D3C80_2028130 [compost metagenome]